jgi:hypothetical protein
MGRIKLIRRMKAEKRLIALLEEYDEFP